MTWSPAARVPCSARLSAPVALCVKMIRDESEIEKVRQLPHAPEKEYARLPETGDIHPDLEKLLHHAWHAEQLHKLSPAGNDVAALSRYTESS